MSDFTQVLQLEIDEKTGLWKTQRELVYELGCKGSGILINIPTGTLTDLGSIPSIARVLLNPADPKFAAAFVLHDYLCNYRNFTRIVTDTILYEALLILGVKKWQAYLIYTGVTLYRIFVYRSR